MISKTHKPASRTTNKYSTYKTVPCRKIREKNTEQNSDEVILESILAIDIISGPAHSRNLSHFAQVLRTPGHDEELVMGLFFSLDIINSAQDIISFSPCLRARLDLRTKERVLIELSYLKNFIPSNFSHVHARNSSCGQCGSNIEAKLLKSYSTNTKIIFDNNTLFDLPAKLNKAQKLFALTGGSHAAALFDHNLELEYIFEDIGRHNALDKLIGFCLKNNKIPLNNNLLAMTSRASFEIVQKASMAGIQTIATMGAVSSLAIDIAKKSGITLIGFLRAGRFNIYC